MNRALLLVLTVFALAGGCQRESGQRVDPGPPADDMGSNDSNSASSIEIVVFTRGRNIGSIKLDNGDALHKDISSYLFEASSLSGKPAWASYAPKLLILSGKTKVNFLDNHMVVSKRHDVNTAWRPVIRSKTDSDRTVEKIIRGLFSAVRTAHSRAETMIQHESIETLDRASLVAAFGQPKADGYFSDWDSAFWLGVPEDTYDVDSKWLVVNYGPDGKVVEARIVQD